jgi:hypothetical protein
MSNLVDVSELMTDPELTEAFQIIHRTAGTGRAPAINSGTPTNAIGCVQPAKQQQLLMLPEGTRIDNVLRLFVATNVTVDTGNGISSVADLIVFRGKKWTVNVVNDWQDHGYREILAVQNDVV